MFTARYVLHSTFCPHSVFMCFVWIWEQTAIISLYNIDWLVFITETGCVYCAVRSTFYVLPTQCICVFCVYLRTNSDYFTVQHWLVGFYNRDGVCLLRSTDWIYMIQVKLVFTCFTVDTSFCHPPPQRCIRWLNAAQSRSKEQLHLFRTAQPSPPTATILLPWLYSCTDVVKWQPKKKRICVAMRHGTHPTSGHTSKQKMAQ